MTTGKRGAPLGNKNNRKGRAWFEALRAELAMFEDKGRNIERGQALRAIAKKCVEQAIDGDKDARTEIANRLDGKPKETIEAQFTQAVVEELTDEQLLDIARRSGDRAADEAQCEEDSPGIH